MVGRSDLVVVPGSVWNAGGHIIFAPKKENESGGINQTYIRDGERRDIFHDVYLNLTQMKRIWPNIELQEGARGYTIAARREHRSQKEKGRPRRRQRERIGNRSIIGFFLLRTKRNHAKRLWQRKRTFDALPGSHRPVSARCCGACQLKRAAEAALNARTLGRAIDYTLRAAAGRLRCRAALRRYFCAVREGPTRY